MEEYVLSSFLQEITQGPHIVKGYYVYAWMDGGKIFYVGMGKGRRAWNQHLDHVETVRQEALSFKVRILRHRLTKAMAHNHERFVIRQLIAQGNHLVNRKVPHARIVKEA